MPHSLATQQLYDHAHRLGDVYYECISRSIRLKNEDRKDCGKCAFEYLTGLETLRSHLGTLQKTPNVLKIIESTDQFLDLLHRDFKQYPGIIEKTANGNDGEP